MRDAQFIAWERLTVDLDTSISGLLIVTINLQTTTQII